MSKKEQHERINQEINKDIMRYPMLATLELMRLSLQEFSHLIMNNNIKDLKGTLENFGSIYEKYGSKFEICRDVMTPDETEVIQAILAFFVMFFGGKKKYEK